LIIIITQQTELNPKIIKSGLNIPDINNQNPNRRKNFTKFFKFSPKFLRNF